MLKFLLSFSSLCKLVELTTVVTMFSISERKLDGLSGDLVNGDHLSIPGMRDYPYGSLGAYNQMSPSPKSVTPQSPSSASMSYTVGEFAARPFQAVVPLYLILFGCATEFAQMLSVIVTLYCHTLQAICIYSTRGILPDLEVLVHC